MSDATLRDLVLARLDKDTGAEDEWSALVLAALESPEELDQLPVPSCRITAQGFRGIGPEATLDLTPGPGLTLVVGRNGSGKSSFAEGLELLLTGDTYRWSQRSKVWRDGWRNLHHPQAALIRWICILPFQPPGSRNEATYPRDTLSSFRQLILESIPYRPRGVTWPASGGEQWTRGGCGTIASDGAP